METYRFIENIMDEITVPEKGIWSQTLQRDGDTKVVIFGFAAGEELSEHTASVPAILHFIDGKADVTLGSDRFTAKAGTWAYMPPKLPHSIRAETDLRLVLYLLPASK